MAFEVNRGRNFHEPGDRKLASCLLARAVSRALGHAGGAQAKNSHMQLTALCNCMEVPRFVSCNYSAATGPEPATCT